MTYTKLDNSYILTTSKKIRAIELLGGKCSRCDAYEHYVLEFHHLRDKDDRISALIKLRWSKIQSEISKCVLLCVNCHREEHIDKNSRTNILKQKLLAIRGITSCTKCGYNGLGLDFHHEIPDGKEFHVSTMLSKNNGISHDGAINYQKLIDEIFKCTVLCGNCHRKEHYDFDRFKQYEVDIMLKSRSYVECPKQVSIDDVSRLLNLGFSKVQISRELGCAKSTVTKYCKIIEENLVG